MMARSRFGYSRAEFDDELPRVLFRLIDAWVDTERVQAGEEPETLPAMDGFYL